MAEYTVEGTEGAGYVSGLVPKAVKALAESQLGSKTAVLAEIDAMLSAVRDFWQMEPDEVMREISAYTARCTELYVQLHRVEGVHREWRQVRTQQVVPLLDELDRQYKNASRMLEVRRQDLDAVRGMT